MYPASQGEIPTAWHHVPQNPGILPSGHRDGQIQRFFPYGFSNESMHWLKGKSKHRKPWFYPWNYRGLL